MKRIIETPDFYNLLGIETDSDLQTIKESFQEIYDCKHFEVISHILTSSELKAIYDSKILKSYREENMSEWYYWGLIYMLAGRHQKAIEYLSEVDTETEDFNSEAVYLSLAVAHKDINNNTEAVKYFKKVLSQNQENVDALCSLIEVFYIEDEEEELQYYSHHAVSVIEKHIANTAVSTESRKHLLKNLISIYRFNDDEISAEEAIDVLIELDCEDIESLQAAARYFYEIQHYETALTYLKKAESLDSKNYRILLDLGFVFFELNLPGLAVEYFMKAKKLNGVDTEIDTLVNKINEIREINGGTVEEFIYTMQGKNRDDISCGTGLEKASVMFFDNEKGFGFANPASDKKKKVFIHYFAMEDTDLFLDKGDTIYIKFHQKKEEYIAFWITVNKDKVSSSGKTSGTVKSICEQRNYGIIEFEMNGSTNEAIFFLNSLNHTLREKLKIGLEADFNVEIKELDSGKTVYNAKNVEF